MHPVVVLYPQPLKQTISRHTSVTINQLVCRHIGAYRLLASWVPTPGRHYLTMPVASLRYMSQVHAAPVNTTFGKRI